jgi:hypothetical protein
MEAYMSKLTEAVRSGDRRSMLEALQNTIAETIDGTDSGRDIAALSKRLLEVSAELEAIPQDPASTPLGRARASHAS